MKKKSQKKEDKQKQQQKQPKSSKRLKKEEDVEEAWSSSADDGEDNPTQLIEHRISEIKLKNAITDETNNNNCPGLCFASMNVLSR